MLWRGDPRKRHVGRLPLTLGSSPQHFSLSPSWLFCACGRLACGLVSALAHPGHLWHPHLAAGFPPCLLSQIVDGTGPNSCFQASHTYGSHGPRVTPRTLKLDLTCEADSL